MSQPTVFWVYLEHNDGALESVALELVSKALELAAPLGSPVCGLLLGWKVAALAEEALRYGLDEVLVADHPLLEQYRTDAYLQAAAQTVEKGGPDIFLMGATPNGRDLAGRLAVRFRTGLTADCTDLQIQQHEDKTLLVGEVTGFGGGIAALITCPRRKPQMATVRPGIFRAAVPKKESQGKILSTKVLVDAEKIRTQIIETHRHSDGSDITKAKRLVVGGRGTQGDFRPLKELAVLLGAEVAATRVAVDEGWVSRELQIGQTGYAARPQIAIVCGASGALQFTVGLAEAEKIIAINTDREAPIFESADYCVIGDLFQILPALIEEIKKTGGPARSQEILNE